MSKEAVFTLKLEPELRAAFMAEAEAAHRPASQVVRELMREFVERQRQAREYEAVVHVARLWPPAERADESADYAAGARKMH